MTSFLAPRLAPWLLALPLAACSPGPQAASPAGDPVAIPTASAVASSPAPLPRPTASAPARACRSDADCVPASCCHPTACTLASEAPSCSGVMCTRECRGGSFECGKGACACQDGQCAVAWR